MSGYQYTYPTDTSFIDAATEPGRIRDAAHRLHRACQVSGGDLWDLVEDDTSLTDVEKNEVHRVFAADESVEEIAAMRASGVRYSR